MEPHSTQKRIIRDYTPKLAEEDELDRLPETLQMVRAVIARYDAVKRLPHIVLPAAAAEFDHMVEICDTIALEFAGRLEAIVDFKCYEAHINLDIAYIEFCQDDFMETLRRLTNSAILIRIFPLQASPLFRIEINMPYFAPLANTR